MRLRSRRGIWRAEDAALPAPAAGVRTLLLDEVLSRCDPTLPESVGAVVSMRVNGAPVHHLGGHVLRSGRRWLFFLRWMPRPRRYERSFRRSGATSRSPSTALGTRSPSGRSSAWRTAFLRAR